MAPDVIIGVIEEVELLEKLDEVEVKSVSVSVELKPLELVVSV